MKMIKFVTKTLFYVGLCASVCVVNAAEIGRSRVGQNQNGTNASRMPTLPVMTMNTVGNPVVGTVTEPINVNSGNVIPTPPTPPTPPAPEPECADGGVRNTDYTVSMCMNELRLCVDAGAVEGGLHGLFNDEYFARVLNGNLRICQNVVDKCLDIRKDCRKVYRTYKSVWADFKSRILWPEYYNFVLYKTGLTPNQAKKTCTRLGAKWDAVNADCVVCVVAYNKDKPISNEWLFGAAGNGKDAEACLKMGESFTCNKSLFGFSLLNDTATVAATAIPGGAIVGGVIGGVAAKSKQNKVMDTPCASKDFRQKLGKQIQSGENNRLLKTYLYDAGRDQYGYYSGYYAGGDESTAKAVPDTFYNMDEATCELIMDLYAKAKLYEDGIEACEADAELNYVASLLPKGDIKSQITDIVLQDDKRVCYTQGTVQCVSAKSGLTQQTLDAFKSQCMFIPLQLGYTVNNENSPFCTHNGDCRTVNQIKSELSRLRGLLDAIAVVTDDSNAPSVGKGILVGGTIGAATGGLATGITALIESNNIKCVVGDDLASVALNKSHTISSLKDFYVKKGFSLPDTIIPTTVVSDRDSWAVACSEYAGNPEDCSNAQVVYKHGNAREIISAACEAQGSTCGVNEDVAQSHLTQLAD